MRKILSLSTIFIVFASGISSAQVLQIQVNLRHTQTHTIDVELDVQKFRAPTVTYQMPIWAPGAYSVTHYGHYVSNFQAFDSKGSPLKVMQIDGDRWSIAGARSITKITYSVADSHKDSTSLYFALCHIDTNYFFANGTCLFGYVNDKKNVHAVVTYNFPETWQLATALDPSIAFPENYRAQPDFKLRTFAATNYDELADAPVMAGVGMQTRTFKEGSAWYDIFLSSDRIFPMDSLEETMKKIVRAETEFFHDTPFNHYTFLINAPTFFKSPSGAQGALEHMNSSAYLLINFPWSTFKEFGLQIFSHEFFHLWNVKRIHSSLLGPFDYTKRVLTTSLWLSEGITDYYAHTILTRWGIAPYRTFESMVSDLSRAVKSSKSARTKTLEELSIAESDFDMTNATVFYTKGTLVGLLLDIEIRTRTQNKKSLDDVMFSLNEDAKKGKTFKDSLLIVKMEKITGLDLHDFYKKFIAGTDSLPIDEYLKKMGVGTVDTANTTSEEFSVADNFLGSLRPTTDVVKQSESPEFVFYKIPDGSAISTGGVKMDDTLKAVNGERFTLDKFIELGKNFKQPLTLDFDVARPSGTKHLIIKYEKPPVSSQSASKRSRRGTTHYVPLQEVSPLQIAIRRAIVGKNY